MSGTEGHASFQYGIASTSNCLWHIHAMPQSRNCCLWAQALVRWVAFKASGECAAAHFLTASISWSEQPWHELWLGISSPVQVSPPPMAELYFANSSCILDDWQAHFGWQSKID